MSETTPAASAVPAAQAAAGWAPRTWLQVTILTYAGAAAWAAAWFWEGPSAALAWGCILAAWLPIHLGINAAGLWLAGSSEPLGLVGFWRCALGEWRSSVRMFLLEQPWLNGRTQPQPARMAPGSVPVLLLHGYFCTEALWFRLQQQLAAQGVASRAISLRPALASIDALVPQVAAAVDALRAATGATQVAIVGHSMGGLVARAYLRAHGASAVAQLITIGSPHHGTRHARLGLGRNARQMELNNRWLAELAAHEEAHPLPPTTVILSRHDNVVAPQDDQTLPGAETLRFSRLGHLALLDDARVQATVRLLLSPSAQAQ
ncbi:MAG TPA: alpha/beta fold hydrolase [Burkholderiaceae bacterium]|nr:alpha/beta fold hydrolase [Burkholderiaceae bacterium]